MSDTRTEGFDWYIGNNAKNSINPAWWESVPPSLPVNFSSSNSILTVNSSGSNWQSMFYSVAFPNAGGHVGKSWQAPVLFDGYFSWDNSTKKTAAYWGHAVEAMAGTIAADAHWLEWDWVDVGLTRLAVNDEYVSGGTPTVINRGASINTSSYPMKGNNSFNRLSGLWLSMASNSNTFGTFMTFYNGQMIGYSDIAYSASENQPPIVDANQALLSTFEALHMPIMFDIQNTGLNSGGPASIDWLRVYTP